jgi:hypothetical protein
MPKNSRAEFIVDASNLNAALTANAQELPNIAPLHQELITVVTELQDLGILQDAQTAAVQQTSQAIKERMTRGKILVTRLRQGVKSHYGTRTEKVIEFGVRPYRKAVRAPKIIVVKETETTTKAAAPEAAAP